jgi:endonuclease III
VADESGDRVAAQHVGGHGKHELLRQHGQELCRRSSPRCGECPVQTGCAYNRNAALNQ